jgi:hypothetical protein
MKAFAIALGVLGVVTLGACSGESKIGEACDEPGRTEDVCESGGICAKDSIGNLMCQRICTDHTQCAADEDCNGVEGSNLKGCRPKSGTGSSGGDEDSGKK